MKTDITQEVLSQLSLMANFIPKLGIVQFTTIFVCLFIAGCCIIFFCWFLISQHSMDKIDIKLGCTILSLLTVSGSIYLGNIVSFNHNIKGPFLNSIHAIKYESTSPIDKMTKEYIELGNPIYLKDMETQSVIGKEKVVCTDKSTVMVKSELAPYIKLDAIKVEYNHELLDKCFMYLSDKQQADIEDLLQINKANNYNIVSITYSEAEDALKSSYTKVAIPSCDVTLDIRDDAVIPTDIGSIPLAQATLTREISDTPKLEVTYGNPCLSVNSDINDNQVRVGSYAYSITAVKIYAPQYTQQSPTVESNVNVNVSVNQEN